MSVILFPLFIGMAITAVITGLVTRRSTFSINFGGVSGASLLTVLLWKPYDRAFQAVMATQRLEIILVGLEEQWLNCGRMGAPDARDECIRAENTAALEAMERVSPI